MTDQANSSVLVVDDTKVNIDILVEALSEDFDVCVAMDGESALRLVAEAPPDLILLDIMMPEMDGYEVCRRLQEDPETRGIPVIFVTTKSEVEDETMGFKLGAVDYIAKPISPPIVLSRVQTHLALKDSRRKLEQFSDKLSRYLPSQVYRSILEGETDARIASCRKKLTVFMSDVVGFTLQTESMEAEDLTSLLNSYLNRMVEIVLAHGGTLDKYIGDAILVFFGDPETEGVAEDACRCLQMAMDMRIAVEELRKEWEQTGICHQFEIRMGIATGYCTVGNFGSEERMDYTIIGSQVNMASRLQSAAAPGEILICPETFLLVGRKFECVAQEPIRVKGFEQLVEPYQVIGALEQGTLQDAVEVSEVGFSLNLDPAAIAPAEKQAVIETLRSAISRMLS